MQIVFQISPDRRLVARAVRRAIRPYLAVIWIGGGIILLSGITLLLLDPWDEAGKGLTFIALGLVLPVLGLLIPTWSARMNGWILASPTTVTVTPDKVSSRSANVSSEFAWSTVRRVHESSDMWIVRLGRTHLVLLPKDGTDEPGRQAFRRLVAERGLAR